MIPIPLTTDRLTIRQFLPDDVDAYLRFMLDDESTRYLAFAEKQKTAAGAKELFDYVLASYGTDEVVHAYAMALNSNDVYVGSCGFAPYEEGVVECYYCVNPEHRGQGFAAEATQALVQALSPQVEVRAYCHPDNLFAHAVARQAGLVHRGRQAHRHSGLAGEVFVCQEAG